MSHTSLKRLLPAVMLLGALSVPPAAQATDSYKLWNHPYRKYDTCVTLKSTTADPPVRWADFNEVDGAGTGYHVLNPTNWSSNSGEDVCANGSNQVRFDLTEMLYTRRPSDGVTARLYFHKGGQGYNPSTTPYGHMWISELLSPAPAPKFTKSTLDSRGADPVKPDPSADSTGYGAGRRCNGDLSPLTQYKVTTSTGPPNVAGGEIWVNDDFTGSGANYSKYANAGRLQGDGTQPFQYLQWSWVGKYDWRDGRPLVAQRLGGGETQGYGAVRTIMKPGTTVTRCDVASITSRAWQANTGTTVGRVTAVYVRTTIGDNELYGWVLHSWQRYNGGDPASNASYGARNCVLAPVNNPTACDEAPPQGAAPNNLGSTLGPDQTMYTDDYLVSDDGRYRLVMQLDGNLVEYGPTGPVWSSGTSSQGARAVMQLDGNLVIYSAGGTPLWSTNTSGRGESRLVVQNDGNLVIYGPNGPTWSRW
ncbi:MAG TPA: hypothetical protein VGW10_11735 [Solirubrobacteraceae bacterium]|nr:hypothetical protein [Solirubrobacteraceae bacterium]